MGSYVFSFIWFQSGIVFILALRGDPLFRLARVYRGLGSYGLIPV